MAELGPILILAVIWLLIGLPLSKVSRKQAGNRPSGSIRRPTPGAAPEAAADRQPEEQPDREPHVMKPTISIGRHDDSLYRGSLNAVTGEGYDPCHDEQLEGLRRAEAVIPVPAPRAVPGLQLSWTANDVVRGVVMSEILNRKK